MSYVAVPSQIIEDHLSGMGFTRGVKGREIVYTRSHKADESLIIHVYTSIRIGRDAVRGKGQDAIRVCLVWHGENASAGMAKSTRVYRTGSEQAVLQRLTQRCREMYAKATELRHGQRCPACGCPVWEDSGRCRNKYCQTQGTPKVSDTRGRPQYRRTPPSPAPRVRPKTQAEIDAELAAEQQRRDREDAERAAEAKARWEEARDRAYYEPEVETQMPEDMRGVF